MDSQQALADIAKNKLLPVYVLTGGERILTARVFDAIRAATVGAGPRGIAEDHYDAAECKPAKVVDAVRSLPMFAKWRLVVVRNVDHWKSEELDAFIPYFDRPAPSGVLVFLSEKLDGRTRFGLALKKKNFIVECLPPTERDLVPWVEGEAKRRGTSFGPGAAASLALTIGTDLSALSDALDRLLLFASGRAITEEDVDVVVAPLREAGQFDLPEAVADRDLPRSLHLLDNLLRQKKPALLLLTFIALRIRQIARARDALDRGDDPGSVLRGKMPPQAVSKVAAQTKRWTLVHVQRALRAIAVADAKLKSGGGRDREARVMEELFLTLNGAPGLNEPALR